MRALTLAIILVISGLLLSLSKGKEALLDFAVDKRESTILYTLIGIVDYLHFKPREINDNFSQDLVKDYITFLDGNKRFLLQSEVDALLKFNNEVDDEINRFSLNFFDQSVSIIDNAIDRSQTHYEALITGDFDLTIDEIIELDADKKSTSKDELELIENWRKTLKYNIVSKIDILKENDDNAEMSDQDLYLKAKQDVKKLFDDWFKRIQDSRREERFDVYMNAILQQFDPHSEYFSPKQKENFDIKMGNKLEGIGARLQQADDYIKIYSIVPGGPAWKEGQLEVDDLIVSVKQENEELVDITGMRLDDVIRIVRGDKGTIVTLRVKKKTGTFQNISILRDEVILEEAAAKSVIISLENEVDKIGYINLPLFYSTFDGGNSCATDVEKEIEKLNAENVNGIIIDLRYNGGGSLPDVITMAGLFIEKGPILQVKGREKKPQVHYDEDKSVKYDGPLIVMVNEVSASSSEILVGALQDYKRAVIVGGERTFGKATVQGVYDLDRMIKDDDGMKPLGQVKLTTQKFFRISGKSNQLKGVVPDIHLPDQFDFTEYGESQYEDALTYSEINPVQYNQKVYKVKGLDELKRNSEARVSNNNDFTKVQQYGQLLKLNEDKTTASLNLMTYIVEANQREKEMEPYADLFDAPIDGLLVRNISADLEKINKEESTIQSNKEFLSDLSKDFYLKETLLVMKDMLETDKRLVKK